MDDFNAKRGIEDHNLRLDNHINQLLPDTNSIQDGNWCSCDDKTNSYRRILLKLCNKPNLKIFNGQSPGYRVGNYKCFNRWGASVVDYLLEEKHIDQIVEKLKILLPEFDSEHTPITTTFRIKTTHNGIGKPPKVYNWDNQGSTNFSSVISCKDSKI